MKTQGPCETTLTKGIAIRRLLCNLGWHETPLVPENYRLEHRAARRREHREWRPTGRWWCRRCGREVHAFRRLPPATLWTDLKCLLGLHGPILGDRWVRCCALCMRVVHEES